LPLQGGDPTAVDPQAPTVAAPGTGAPDVATVLNTVRYLGPIETADRTLLRLETGLLRTASLSEPRRLSTRILLRLELKGVVQLTAQPIETAGRTLLRLEIQRRDSDLIREGPDPSVIQNRPIPRLNAGCN